MTISLRVACGGGEGVNAVVVVLWGQSQQTAKELNASGQFSEKPPIFCKHAARTFIWIKNEDAIKKSENLPDTCPC